MFRKEPSTLLMQRPPTDADAVTPAHGFQTVVIGVDFSPASLRAARWVGTQLAPNATLVLAHIVSQPTLPIYLRTAERPMPAWRASDADGLTGGLLGLAETLGAHRTRIMIRTGMPAQALARLAEEVGADLLCIGRGPRPRESARFGGTTPLRLLAWTRIPTLVVPMVDLGAPRPIVAGLDDRHGGQQVLDVAGMLAGRLNASVDAVHVIEPEFRQFVESSPTAGTRGGTHSASWLDERAQRWAERSIAETGRAGRSAAVVVSGDPGQELMRHARERRAGLIVVGQGGTADRAELPLGSLSPGSSTRLLLWASPCPVLVVPLAPQPAERPAAAVEHTVEHARAPRRRAHAHVGAHPRPERTPSSVSLTLPAEMLHVHSH